MDQEGPRKKARTSSLAASIGDLLSTGKYSDLEIRCDGKSFKVHRNIVCGWSDVMDKECDGGFVEAQTRVIKHSVFDSSTMDRMLQFMYRNDYQLETACPTSPDPDIGAEDKEVSPFGEPLDEMLGNSEADNELVMHVYVYAIADYYELSALQELAVQKFNSAKSILAKAPNIDESAKSIVATASIVYANTTKQAFDLRLAMVSLALDHQRATLDRQVFMEALANWSDLQEFAVDILSESTIRHREAQTTANQKVYESFNLAKRHCLDARAAGQRADDLMARLRAEQQTVDELRLDCLAKDGEIDRLTGRVRNPRTR